MGTNRSKFMAAMAGVAGLMLAGSASAGGSAYVEEPPRAMYGTTAWSGGWDEVCYSLDFSTPASAARYDEHVRKDCALYTKAFVLRDGVLSFAQKDER